MTTDVRNFINDNKTAAEDLLVRNVGLLKRLFNLKVKSPTDFKFSRKTISVYPNVTVARKTTYVGTIVDNRYVIAEFVNGDFTTAWFVDDIDKKLNPLTNLINKLKTNLNDATSIIRSKTFTTDMFDSLVWKLK